MQKLVPGPRRFRAVALGPHRGDDLVPRGGSLQETNREMEAKNALELICEDFSSALELLRSAGFRLDVIYPADEPRAAILSMGGRSVRLKAPDAPELPCSLPPFDAGFVLTKAGVSSVEGRAGMAYRDLIPGRLGGRYIASHIAIAKPGPVADWVHFHRIAVQMIYVRRGWVRLVYEGQGEPFVMNEGDLVLQPPEIRHRVLESSSGLEVIEITAPALHETLADHEFLLPGDAGGKGDNLGQSFLYHQASGAPWTNFAAGEAQETGVKLASRSLLDARTIRPCGAREVAFAPHDGELVFGFVLEGSARLDFGSGFDLGPADAFVVPPQQGWNLRKMAKDFRFLHVTTGRLDAAPQCLL